MAAMTAMAIPEAKKRKRARAEGRHLAHGDADGEVGGAPDHVDEAQRDPRQQTAMTGGHV
jgi:hypothetical protein